MLSIQSKIVFLITEKMSEGTFSHVVAQMCFVEFFRFSNFQQLQKMGIFIFPKIVSATIFGLITQIIKLFQTVQIEKARL